MSTQMQHSSMSSVGNWGSCRLAASHASRYPLRSSMPSLQLDCTHTSPDLLQACADLHLAQGATHTDALRTAFCVLACSTAQHQDSVNVSMVQHAGHGRQTLDFRNYVNPKSCFMLIAAALLSLHSPSSVAQKSCLPAGQGAPPAQRCTRRL